MTGSGPHLRLGVPTEGTHPLQAGERRHEGVWLPRGVRVRASGLPFIYPIIWLMPVSLTGL